MNAKRLYVTLGLTLLLALGAGLALAQGSRPQAPVGSAFAYQGRLTDMAGSPIDDTCDFRFSLWDDDDVGSQVGSTVEVTGKDVEGGLFTVQLDFGSLFDGTALWLEVEVKCSGDAGYVGLDPRQPLTAAPYTLHALNAELLDGQEAADFWNLAGNTGTSPADFLGTTDSQPLLFKTNNAEAMRIQTDGDVSIGTTASAGVLHVAGSSVPDALVVKDNGNVGFGTDNPYEAQVQIVNQDPAAGSDSSLKIGGYNTTSSTAYNARLALRSSVGGAATLSFHDQLQGTKVVFRKAPSLVSGAWFEVINEHDVAADQMVYKFYNSGASSNANDRMVVMVPLGVGHENPSAALDVVGDAEIDGDLALTGQLNGGTAWTSANDGAGSGLDADMLDGLHAGELARIGRYAIPSGGGMVAIPFPHYNIFQVTIGEAHASPTKVAWMSGIENDGNLAWLAIDSNGVVSTGTCDLDNTTQILAMGASITLSCPGNGNLELTLTSSTEEMRVFRIW